MDGAQTLLGEAGACPEIEWNGTTWKIGWPTQAAKAVLEELVAARAVRAVTALKGVLTPAEYADAYGEVVRQITAGEYRTWAPGWVRGVGGPDGRVLHVQALLRTHHPRATEADAAGLLAECPDELDAALARVTPRFFGVLADAIPGATPEVKAHARRVMADQFARATPTSTPPGTTSAPSTPS